MANDVKVLIDLVKRGDGAERATKELRNLGTESAKSKKTLLELYAGVGLVQQGFAAISGVIRGVWSVLEQGAALEKTALQFDRLTESIGSTSDAMLGRLKEATRGMVSDAELMASASQIIGLGLAKTEEDTVRLARVISGLGLDMQQVIMTFANNSVMRLDALGLSVENVTRRAKELEDAGFEGDAFDAAVLAELEKRYELLGGEMDTAATSLARLETAAINARDAFSSAFVQGAADGLATMAVNANAAADAMERYAAAMGGESGRILSQILAPLTVVGEEMMLLDEALERNIITQEAYDGQMNRLILGFRIKKSVLEDIRLGMDLLDRLEQDNIETTEELTVATDGLGQSFADMSPALAAIIEQGRQYGEMTRENTEATERFKEELRKAYDLQSSPYRQYTGGGGRMDPNVAGRILQAEKQYGAGAADLPRQFFGSYVSAAERAMQANAQFNNSFLSILDAMGRDGFKAPDPFEQLFRSAAQSGAAIDKVVELGEAVGKSREEMEKAAAITYQQAFAESLGEKIARGMSIEDALAEMAAFNEEIANGTATLDELGSGNEVVVDYSDASEARSVIAEAYNDMSSLAGTFWHIRGKVDIDGIPDGPGSRTSKSKPDGKASGGPVSSGMPYMVGEHGPEWFVPKDSGYIVNQQQAAQAVGGGGGAVTITQIFNDRAAAALGMAQIAQLQRARRSGAFA